MPRPSPSPFPTNRPNFFVEPSTTIESLKNSSTRCELLASKCSSTPSKDPHVEKEEYHPKCALSSRHSTQGLPLPGNYSPPRRLSGHGPASTLPPPSGNSRALPLRHGDRMNFLNPDVH